MRISDRFRIKSAMTEEKRLLRRRLLAMTRTRIIILVLLVAISASFFAIKTKAEQTGSSPESGATSRIKAAYDSLVSLGNGTDAAGGWGDWGAMWNRIRSAAEYVPSGNSAVTDVKSGKTFYSNTRAQQTGTYPASGPCSTEQYHDSYGAPVTETTNCTNTITWTTASPGVTGDDAGNGNTDPRTGLIWSKLLLNSAGTVTFSAGSNSSWSWDGTTDADNIAVGGKTAALLCSERGNGWRLPTQKELMQAYIDGSNFNLTQPGNTYFWSLTEYSSTNAWYVYLSNGYTSYLNKASSSSQVRCVR